MPPECQGRDTEVLNEKGSVIEVIESEQTHAVTAAREAEETQRLKERNAQLQRDRVLLETYLAVSDIERLRDQRVELLEAQLKVAEQHIDTLQGRLNELRQQSARFKPYNDAPNSPPLPDHIAEALINTVKSIAVDRETMQHKKNEQAELTASFDRDIKRFKELKSAK
jgi:molybdopterin-guanine dinucleotide biosynthesis protein